MSTNYAFSPAYGTGQTLTPGAASATVTIQRSMNQIRVLNTGAAIGYFRTFNSRAATDKPATGVATTADLGVAPGMSTTVSKDLSHDSMAFISATGTTFIIIQGEGV